MQNTKGPLYRKENKRALHYNGDKGGDFRHTRNSKAFKEFDGDKMGMKGDKQRGRDYTPLFRFLFSRVGKDWTATHSEAASRLDNQEPIWWMVAANEAEKRDYVRLGESSLWSGLYVDENNVLQKVNPDLKNEDLYPWCSCHTHSFNGEPLVNKFEGIDTLGTKL
jgi:hypothetical protein